MGYKPERCIVIEDSDVGVQAAISAKMKVLKYSQEEEEVKDITVTNFTNMLELPNLVHLAFSNIQNHSSRIT